MNSQDSSSRSKSSESQDSSKPSIIEEQNLVSLPIPQSTKRRRSSTIFNSEAKNPAKKRRSILPGENAIKKLQPKPRPSEHQNRLQLSKHIL